MGMKNASVIFRRTGTMEQILSDLKGVLIYQDDVLIYAANKDSLQKRLAAVSKRLQEKFITVNENKSVAYMDKVTFLGFTVLGKGIAPDQKLVERISNMKAPVNKRRLRHLWALSIILDD